MKHHNKLTSIALISTLFCTLSFAKSTPLTEEKLRELGSTVTLFKRPNITLTDGVDEGKYYFLQLSYQKKGRSKKVNAFLDKESGAVYIGSRYDKNGKKSTFPKTAKSVAAIKDGISFTYGNGGKDLYIVTDPECPYCRTFEKEAKGKLDSYTVHVILYPLSFHKEAPAMTEWIMRGKDDTEKQKRMEDVMINHSTEYKKLLAKKGEKFQYTPNIKTKIDAATRATKALGATGTPSVYTSDFNKIGWKTLTKAQVTKLPQFKKAPATNQK